jgi:putative alpha-1,2-mannosidase
MYAGAPFKTQARLRQIVDSQYKPTPDGLVGNDDLGQMSAWLVFTSLGFYPVAPGSNQYILGRPFVDRAVLHLPNGKQLAIVSENMDASHGFLKDVRLNGLSLDRAYVTHDELMQGGELKFVFSSEKDATWSRRSLHPPYSISAVE